MFVRFYFHDVLGVCFEIRDEPYGIVMFLESGIQTIMLVRPMLDQRHRQYIHYTTMWYSGYFGYFVVFWVIISAADMT